MTNRHVAEVFAAGVGDGRLDFVPGRGSSIELGSNPDDGDAQGLPIRNVAMIHPYWDIALLRVDGLTDDHPALSLMVAAEEEFADRNVVVIGYPTFDFRKAPDIQTRVFGSRFNVKRLMLRKGEGRHPVASFGRELSAFAHDASTLGAHSGSAVIDPLSGYVVGLHFSGRYLDTNFAAPASEMARDHRIVDAGVNFATWVRPDASTSHEWWKAVAAGVAFAATGGAAVAYSLAAAAHPNSDGAEKPPADKAGAGPSTAPDKAAPAKGADHSDGKASETDPGLGNLALDALNETTFGKAAVDAIGGNRVAKAALNVLGGAPLDKAAADALGGTATGKLAAAALGDKGVGKAALAAIGGGSVGQAALDALGDNPLGKAARATFGGSQDKSAPDHADGDKSAGPAALAALGGSPLGQAASSALGDSPLGQSLSALGLPKLEFKRAIARVGRVRPAPSRLSPFLFKSICASMSRPSRVRPGSARPTGACRRLGGAAPTAAAANEIPIAVNVKFEHELNHVGQVNHLTAGVPGRRNLLGDLGGATLGGGMGAGLGATLGPALTALHLGGSSSGSNSSNSSTGPSSSSSSSSSSSLSTTPPSAPSAAPDPDVQPSATTPDLPHHSHGGVPHASPDSLGSGIVFNGTPSPWDDAPAAANPTQSSETWPLNFHGFDMPPWGLMFVPPSGATVGSDATASDGNSAPQLNSQPSALRSSGAGLVPRVISQLGKSGSPHGGGQGLQLPVPEPSPLTMLTIGFGAVAGAIYARRRRPASAASRTSNS
jgi:Trypsin-like peptidase domain